MKNLSQWLYRISKGWVVLITLLLFAGFIGGILPAQAKKAAATANGADSPDSSFFYSARDLYQAAETYGADGRSAYIRARWTFDVAWPLSYTVFLSAAISWFLARTAAEGSKWRLLNLFPITGMVFDFLENIATTVVMARFPSTSPLFAHLAPIFTLVKWFFVNGSFVILLAALVVVIFRKKKNL